MEVTVKRLIKNFFSLNAIQIANFVFPLLTLPYIVRVIGPEKYGTINFAQAVIAYFTLVMLYSFDLSVTREVSARRDDKEFVSRIFYTVISTRLFLFVCLSLPFVLLLLVPRFSIEWKVFIILFFMNLGVALFPMFFFQGIEQMTRVALFNFLIKFIFTVSIFLFLRTEQDYLVVPFSLTLGHVIVGIISFLYAIRRYSLQFYFPSFEEVKTLLQKGGRLFISSITINLYTTTNTVLLGLFVGDVAVGYFAAAEKIVTIVQSLTLFPLSQVLFPFFSKIIHDDREKGIQHLEHVYVWVGIGSFLASVVVFTFAPIVVQILYGYKFTPAVPVLYILSWLLFLRGLSGITGIQGLLNLKMDREYLRITTLGMILCIVLNIFFLPLFSERGAALAWILTEIFISSAMLYVLQKRGIFSLSFTKIKTILSRLPNV